MKQETGGREENDLHKYHFPEYKEGPEGIEKNLFATDVLSGLVLGRSVLARREKLTRSSPRPDTPHQCLHIKSTNDLLMTS